MLSIAKDMQKESETSNGVRVYITTWSIDEETILKINQHSTPNYNTSYPNRVKRQDTIHRDASIEKRNARCYAARKKSKSPISSSKSFSPIFNTGISYIYLGKISIPAL